ncbi:uncharacterized protein CEXT_640101 [Caerostris extrusa]|uniref:EB domain-containing protein n=1 Tax=Caerostris extrusa TaxID=172846 RepID=A0AAV4NGI6_CAEEX|nr:uncharacterized protein CEXT_640101 [Caerostris extrusa]
MVTSVLLILLLLLNLISEGWNHVGQPCNKIFRLCLTSNSYCDKENICRCKPDYPVNVSLHSCRKGKLYSEKCDYTEECSYYDPNSYCSQLPYRSICECHTGFIFNEVTKICESVGKDTPKSSNLVFPTAIGGSLALASILFFCLVAWQVCKRQNARSRNFRRDTSSRSRYQSAYLESQGAVPSAPTADETLPTYDTALSLKISEDCEPPPSYDEVIGQAQLSKT